MEMFRETALHVFWPLCILLWTILAAIAIGEHIVRHRHTVKSLAHRLDKLERANRKAVRKSSKEDHG